VKYLTLTQFAALHNRSEAECRRLVKLGRIVVEAIEIDGKPRIMIPADTYWPEPHHAGRPRKIK
jgi:hypothetical protein